ncbi:p37 [Japanese holly fern mottle virus]|uniref:p37 n=1 Tax=Japanese holly fern mottle virus TaxID=659660 RepID=C7T4Z7_9VIRU|nr:unnamed protein product [Japanese holly fern mottle virus]ACT67467.1 p37 [Japanese holly fern mottle virus]
MKGASGLRRLGFRAVVPAVVVGGAVAGTVVHRALNNRGGDGENLRDLRELRPLEVEEFTISSGDSVAESIDIDSAAVNSAADLVPFDAVLEPEEPVTLPVSNPRRIWSRLFAAMVTLSVPLAGVFAVRHVTGQGSVSAGDDLRPEPFGPRDVPRPDEIPPHAAVEEGDPVACLPEDSRRFVKRCLDHLAYFELVGVCPFCERDGLKSISFEAVVFEEVPPLFVGKFELIPSAVFDPHFWEPLCYYTLFQDMLVCKCGKHDRYHVVKIYPVMDVHPLNTVYMLFIVKEGFDVDRGFPVMSSYGYHVGWAFEPLTIPLEPFDGTEPLPLHNETGR